MLGLTNVKVNSKMFFCDFPKLYSKDLPCAKGGAGREKVLFLLTETKSLEVPFMPGPPRCCYQIESSDSVLETAFLES